MRSAPFAAVVPSTDSSGCHADLRGEGTIEVDDQQFHLVKTSLQQLFREAMGVSGVWGGGEARKTRLPHLS